MENLKELLTNQYEFNILILCFMIIVIIYLVKMSLMQDSIEGKIDKLLNGEAVKLREERHVKTSCKVDIKDVIKNMPGLDVT